MGQKRSRIGSVAATEPTRAKRRSFTGLHAGAKRASTDAYGWRRVATLGPPYNPYLALEPSRPSDFRQAEPPIPA